MKGGGSWIFYLESQNTLLMALPRKRINKDIWGQYLEAITALPIDVDYGSCDAYIATSIAKIAKQYQLTTYDAAYVELAKQKK